MKKKIIETKKESINLLSLIDLPESAWAALPNAFRLDRAERKSSGDWVLPKSPEIYRGIVTGYQGSVNATLLEQLPNLEFIACFTSGRDMVDLEAAAAYGITVVSNNAALADSVADHAFALLLGLARDIPGCDKHVRSGVWHRRRHTPGSLLMDKKLGIAGYGVIGQGVARRASAFGMNVGVFSRRDPEISEQKFFSNLGELSEWADWLVLALPGGKDTHNIVNSEVLCKLGPYGRIVNVGRGTLIDETAMISALQNGIIAGAALDVFISEPNPAPELLNLPNVLLSPHQASNTLEAEIFRSTAFADILSTHFFTSEDDHYFSKGNYEEKQ